MTDLAWIEPAPAGPRSGLREALWAALGAALAIGLALGVYRWTTRTEPLYRGRTAAAWAIDLNSSFAAERREAKEAIAGFDAAALPSLERLLRTHDPLLARGLNRFGPRLPARWNRWLSRWIHPLEAPFKRSSAVEALGLMGPRAAPAVPALREALADEELISWKAALALVQLGEPGRQALIASLGQSSKLPCFSVGAICYALGSSGRVLTNAIPALDHVMKTGCPKGADNAAQALATMGRVAAPILIEALEDPDLLVRVRAINALGQMRIEGRQALPRLIGIAKTDQTMARAAAVDALSQILPGSDAVNGVLVAGLKDPAREVRLAAVAGLSWSPASARAAVPELIEALRDSGAEVRGNAAQLLGQTGEASDRLLRALSEAQNDPDETVRLKAGQALEHLRAVKR